MRRLAPVSVVTLALAAGVGACGGGSGSSTTANPSAHASGRSAGAVTVIRGWADALRGGDVPGAAHYFALPSLVANGSPPVPLRTVAQAEAFNRALPCGAELVRTVSHGGYVFGAFRLTDRTGPGAQHPCPGKGGTAAVAFRIAGGRIREWRRVTALPGGTPSTPAEPAGPTQST